MKYKFYFLTRSKMVLFLLMTGVLLYLVFLIPSVPAQGPTEERRLTVYEAVKTALQDNHEIKALQSAAGAGKRRRHCPQLSTTQNIV